MSKYFQIVFFILFCGLLLNTAGCGLWRKPWKSWHNADSHKKYGKELPEAPLYSGYSNRSQDELIDQAAVLRHTAPQTVQDSDFAKEEKKPWFKRPLLMSSKASEIDNHLGD